MGVNDIHILIDPEPDPSNHHIQALAVLQQALIEEHRRGEHPWGRMIRACPLCQNS